jgi:hypothetical protein
MTSLVFACSVCFGQSDSPMAIGTNMGIFLMLGVTAVVLASFAGFFLYLMRRARLAELQQAQATASSDRTVDSGGRYAPTEGTA